jgi:hypothetical protein
LVISPYTTGVSPRKNGSDTENISLNLSGIAAATRVQQLHALNVQKK